MCRESFEVGQRDGRKLEREWISKRVKALPSVKVPRDDFEWSGEKVDVLERAAVLAVLRDAAR